MSIIAKVGAALQELFGRFADQAAEESRVIVRKRKFTPSSLATTFVLGHLQHPDATDEQLAQVAAQAGADVTAQAIDQRRTPALMNFLKALFVYATKQVIGSDKSLAPILERFTNVTLLDSTTITLPDSMTEEFPGCGGSYGSGMAAMKLQTELDLRRGAISHVEIEPGRSPDGATIRQHARRGAGSLKIVDLGYFDSSVFATMTQEGEYFLSRLQFGTSVALNDGTPVNLLRWLGTQSGRFIDQAILLGKEQRLACRLIAWRLPKELADRRRQKLIRELKRKGRQPSAERLAWCDWTILVTNVPTEMMFPEEAVILYRSRWQIELLFKRWKSQDMVAMLKGSNDTRQMIGVWSRLLAALLRHWLVTSTVWGDPTKSLVKVCEAIRSFVGRLAASIRRISELESVLADLVKSLRKTCRRNKRSDPGTFELLNDPSLLNFRLT
jgi:Transposase DDE domain